MQEARYCYQLWGATAKVKDAVFDADRADVKEKKLATLQIYTEACSYYNLNAYAEAAQRFEDCLRQNPSDRVAQIYLKRTQAKI
jgi:TolA-binding protein